MQAYQKGTLISWNDNRGFGFIEPGNGAQKVFLHISALKKHGRRPQEGDTIYYQLNFDRKNRVQANHASIKGVQYQTQDPKLSSGRRTNSLRSGQQGFPLWPFLIIAAIAIAIGGINYSRQNRPSHTSRRTQSASPNFISTQYRCSGKTYCSQMTSCGEAKYYLKNCSGVKIDGDGDGIPCEDQWCGH